MTEVSDTNGRNGFTAFLFSLNQYIIPLTIVGLFGFCWQTNSRLIALEATDQSEIQRISDLESNSPPGWLLVDIEELKQGQRDLMKALSAHYQANNGHH